MERHAADSSLTTDPDDPTTVLLTTEQAATAARVRPATIRQWASRGLLTPVDDTPRYRESDVLHVERDTRRTARERQLAAEAIRTLTPP